MSVQNEVPDLKFSQCSRFLLTYMEQYICNTRNVVVTTLDHIDIYT